VSISGPFHGVVVADFSRVLAGPYATMLLGDLRATVIKVESPGGDDTQHWGPPWTSEGESTSYLSVNCNKSIIAVDLASAEGKRGGLAPARRDVHGSAQVAKPLRLSARGVSYRHRPPVLGADEKGIPAWLDDGESADGHKAAGTFR